MNLGLDDGLGVEQTRDLLNVAGAYIDVIRIGRASAAIFNGDWLRAKSKVCADYDVELEAGGPLYEVAYLQGRIAEFYGALLEVGLSSFELSVNVITPDLEEIVRDIRRAKDAGLAVYFEYGRKYPDTQPFDVDEASTTITAALEAGAKQVQIERAEIDLVIDREPEVLVRLAERVGLPNLSFEVGPRTPSYPEKLLALFGGEVNLANLVLDPPGALDGVLLVENARRGMDRSVGYRFLETGARLPFSVAPTQSSASADVA